MKGAEGATERAERALDLLCDERAAAVGYLYLFKKGALRLAAARGAKPPPAEFTRFVHAFLAREAAESAAATRILREAEEPATRVASHYTDALGLTFFPFLLRGVIDKQARYAGVVAFAYHGKPAPVDDALMLAISTHFIESGDSDGLEHGAWQDAGDG
jgi:hypothetical protein